MSKQQNWIGFNVTLLYTIRHFFSDFLTEIEKKKSSQNFNFFFGSGRSEIIIVLRVGAKLMLCGPELVQGKKIQAVQTSNIHIIIFALHCHGKKELSYDLRLLDALLELHSSVWCILDRTSLKWSFDYLLNFKAHNSFVIPSDWQHFFSIFLWNSAFDVVCHGSCWITRISTV